MTGYGRAEVEGVRYRIVVEARSLNSRYLDVSLRLPPGWWTVEPSMRKRVLGRFRRGRIEVHVRWEPLRLEEEPRVELQMGQARAYQRALEAMGRELSLPGAVDLPLMASFRDLLSLPEASPEEERAALEEALDKALEALGGMRRIEGDAIQSDLEARILWMENEINGLNATIPKVVEAFMGRWRDRLQVAMGEHPLDPARLEQEVIIWMDRLDVSEESVRLASHVAQCRKIVREGGEVGRKLDFLLQEMHREVNTLGSKALDAEVSHRVVEMKAQIERMREQVQNVE
jgi:uncharacterized protein (TIGR00255 family)